MDYEITRSLQQARGAAMGGHAQRLILVLQVGALMRIRNKVDKKN